MGKSTFVTIQQHSFSTVCVGISPAGIVHFPPQRGRSDNRGHGAVHGRKCVNGKMGQFPLEQEDHSEVEASIAPRLAESGCRQGKFRDRATFFPSFSYRERRAVWAPEADRGDADAGLDIISGYAEKCGEQHRLGAAQTMMIRGLQPAFMRRRAGRIEIGFSMERHGPDAPRELLEGEFTHGLRAFRGYIRMSGSAVGLTAADADGAKEIDCYA
jgi:hypothetical protein